MMREWENRRTNRARKKELKGRGRLRSHFNEASQRKKWWWSWSWRKDGPSKNICVFGCSIAFFYLHSHTNYTRKKQYQYVYNVPIDNFFCNKQITFFSSKLPITQEIRILIDLALALKHKSLALFSRSVKKQAESVRYKKFIFILLVFIWPCALWK